MKKYTVGNTEIYACGVGGYDDAEAGIYRECHLPSELRSFALAITRDY